MKIQECPVHHVPMEARPTEPRARCPNCGYTKRHTSFERCRECGQPLHIDEPEPHWHCSLCVPERQEAR